MTPAPPEQAAWPAAPPADWRDTCATLHMWTQIVGKTRLALAPMENHWWQVALYVTPRGLTTSAMPSDTRALAAEFDFIDHHLYLRASDGRAGTVPLVARSVAEFYGDYLAALASLGVRPRIRPVPVEVETAIPFAEDRQHASYDADAAQRWWRMLVQADRVFKAFRGRYLGKASPVHFFWGSFDLAYTRFSGREAPRHGGGAPNCPDYVMVEAYSRECSSAGLWPGGGPVAEPAFYAYAYPEPEGYPERPVRPSAAFYHPEMKEFILPYERVRTAPDPDRALLDFLQSTYEAAAGAGRWDQAGLERQAS